MKKYWSRRRRFLQCGSAYESPNGDEVVLLRNGNKTLGKACSVKEIEPFAEVRSPEVEELFTVIDHLP